MTRQIIISNPTENWRDNIPFGAENVYHAEVVNTGFLHDVGIEIILTPIHNGEKVRGWETIDKQIQYCEQIMVNSWEIAENDWAYSFKPII